MKKTKRLLSITLISVILILPTVFSASATDLVDPENIDSIMSYFGIDANDPESVQNAIDQIKNGGLSGIMNLLGINVQDILSELESYLGQVASTTDVSSSEESSVTLTEEQTTEKTVIETTTANTPVYTPVYPSYSYQQEPSTEKPLPVKPSKNETTTAETVTEESTKEIVTVTEIITETSKTTNSTENSSEFSAKTILIVFLTIVIFVSGLGTGIIVTKKISENDRKLED